MGKTWTSAFLTKLDMKDDLNGWTKLLALWCDVWQGAPHLFSPLIGLPTRWAAAVTKGWRQILRGQICPSFKPFPCKLGNSWRLHFCSGMVWDLSTQGWLREEKTQASHLLALSCLPPMPFFSPRPANPWGLSSTVASWDALFVLPSWAPSLPLWHMEMTWAWEVGSETQDTNSSKAGTCFTLFFLIKHFILEVYKII